MHFLIFPSLKTPPFIGLKVEIDRVMILVESKAELSGELTAWCPGFSTDLRNHSSI
jgi:hypothetical protein